MIGVSWPGKAVNAAMLAAAIRVDRPIRKADVRQAIAPGGIDLRMLDRDVVRRVGTPSSAST